MAIVKEIGKKILIAGASGALILGFVYIKDSYLDGGTTDLEELHSTNISKDEPIQKQQKPSQETKLSIKVTTPSNEKPIQDPTPQIDNKIENKPQLSEFERYKQAQLAELENEMDQKNHQHKQSNMAQDELDKEMENY